MDKSHPLTPWRLILEPELLKKVSLAFKCLREGTANEGQQKFIIEFLVITGCRTNDSDWFPDYQVTSLAAGRRFVGMQIVDMINLNVNTLKEKN
jgi:hypothetical protein